MAGVLRLAVSRALKKAAIECGVARFGDIGPRFGLLRRRADTIEGEGKLQLADPGLYQRMKFTDGGPQIIGRRPGRLHDEVGDTGNLKRTAAGPGWAVDDQEVKIGGSLQ